MIVEAINTPQRSMCLFCSDSIALQRKEADSGLIFVNGDQGSRRKLGSVSSEDIEQEFCAKDWGGILRSDLNDAGRVRVGGGKNGAKVKVVGENDIIVLPCPAKYLPVSGVG